MEMYRPGTLQFRMQLVSRESPEAFCMGRLVCGCSVCTPAWCCREICCPCRVLGREEGSVGCCGHIPAYHGA